MSFTATVANPPASVGAVRLGKLPPWASLGILFGVVGVLSIIAWGPIGVSGTYPRIISEAMRVAAPGYAAANPYLVKMGSILVPETFILLGLVVGGLLGARLDRVKAPKMEATYPAAAPAVTSSRA